MQLWLALPRNERWAEPRLQDLKAERVPATRDNGSTIKLYSGSFSGLVSPLLNYTPLLLADISMENGARASHELPGDFNIFIYLIGGELNVGEAQDRLNPGEVGWLDLPGQAGTTNLHLTAGENGARFLVYGGKPTGDPIVSHGPFIGDSTDDIHRLYEAYRKGAMQHIDTVPAGQKLYW